MVHKQELSATLERQFCPHRTRSAGRPARSNEAEQAQLLTAANHSIQAWRSLAPSCIEAGPPSPDQLTLSPLNFAPRAVLSVQGPALTRCTKGQGSGGGGREGEVQVQEGTVQFRCLWQAGG